MHPETYKYTMERKEERLTTVIKLLTQEEITSQDELLQMLLAKGYKLTQATLSRDLKLLKVAKMPDGNGSYRYVLPNAITTPEQILSTQKGTSLEGFLSIEFSGNLGVIRTVPAFSHTIASNLDLANLSPILGTIAGNDTIFIAIKEGNTPNDVLNAIKKKFPDISLKINSI